MRLVTTCLAFAMHLWQGKTSPTMCRPVFDGEHSRLKDALVEICAALGVWETPNDGGAP